jgi:hypothetical protein
MSKTSFLREARVLVPVLVGVAAAVAAAPAVPASTVLCPGQWKRAAPDGPPGRTGGHTLAYDQVRQRVVLFGGYDGKTGTRLGDTWEWDGEQWTFAADTGPSGRTNASLVYDETRQRILLFGGTGQPGNYYGDNNDSWEWDGTTWTDVTSADPDKLPRIRNGQGMAYDTLRQKTMMYGGGITFIRPLFDDTWTRDVTGNWRRRADAGTGPGEITVYTGMTFDREHGLAVLQNGPCETPDTWVFDGNVWSLVSGARPTPRINAPLVYDSARHRVVLHGGDSCDGHARPMDTWEWDGADWLLVAEGDQPGEYPQASPLAYDRRRGEVVRFGGARGSLPESHTTWVWKGPTYRCDVVIPGDINCDGVVDIDDRKILDSARGTPACAADDTRDLDHDGRIDFADKTALEALCTYADCARGPGDKDRD